MNTMWWIWWCATSRTGTNRHESSSLLLSQITLYGEASWQVMSLLRNNYGEVNLASNWNLLPIASEKQRPLANSLGRTPSWRHILQPLSSLQKTVDKLTTTSCMILNQNHPTKPLPNFWPTEACDPISVCCLELLNFGIIFYAVIDNIYINVVNVYILTKLMYLYMYIYIYV